MVKLFKSFWVKVSLILILAMLFIGALNNLLIYRFALNSQFNDLRNSLMILAKTSVLMVDPEELKQIPLNPQGADTQQAKVISQKLKAVIEANPVVRSIYILTKTEKEGTWQFIVDVMLPGVKGKKGAWLASPGDNYNASRFPAMLMAYQEPSADKELGTDEWGTSLSGYAPIRDAQGSVIAVLGVDIAADDVAAMRKELLKRNSFVLIMGIILSLFLGLLISGGITSRVRKLSIGARHISNGDLRYRIAIKGSDEISELARAFNQMASSLAISRRKLLTYFYRVVQSLVRILEAKDHYTRGHSERVAEYAEKIAQKMGFPEEKVELIKEAALLHDIGKLGIQEDILNKKGKLTEQEWLEVQKHPALGEDILEPVFLTKEMLEMIRSHHERFDGQGYPDKIKGENISIFAAIASVADSFDAMTSQRAYRQALSKQEAIAELEKNKGTQFNAKVVDAFIQALREEDK